MFIRRKPLLIFTTIAVILFTSVLVYSFQAGIAGRTPKTSTAGCGGCHGANANPSVTLTWVGPDSLAAGSTALYTLVINASSKTGAGFDIAAGTGTLDTAMPLTKMLNGEVVQTANIPMIAGTSAIVFKYTAPLTPGVVDTLYGTGLASNTDNGSSGDDWNFATKRPIIITSPIGIKENSTAAYFKLNQNYPNPFNPSTTISFQLYKPSTVNLVIYDVLGNEVAALIKNQRMAEGSHTLNWSVNGTANVGSGVYFYKLITDNAQDIKKMVLTK